MNGSSTVRWIPGAWLPLGLLPGFALLASPVLGLELALAYDALLVALGLGTTWRLSRGLGAERLVERRFVLGADNRVTLRLRNRGRRPLRVSIRDDVPEGWSAEPDELSVRLAPFGRAEVSYTVRPPGRGRFEFGDIHLRVEGAGRLGALLVTFEARAEARVYPNVRAAHRYDLALKAGALARLGVRASRHAGGGGEFEQLREYVRGDPLRDVDWKSTAKRRRPITRVYQREHSQTIVVALDTGRMMATRSGELSKLDHAVNAALLLSYVALEQGDRVGLVVFDDEVRGFVPPGRGRGHYPRVLESLFAVEARLSHADFRRFVEFVGGRLPKRSLLVVFSDLLDDSESVQLLEHMRPLRARHLPLCVTMDDPLAREACEQPAHGAADVYRRAAATDIVDERERVKAQLAKSGVGVVEAPAGQLAVAAVNRYLEIKARRAL